MAHAASEQVQDLLNWIGSLPVASEDKAKQERELLPRNVIPSHYFISLTPDLVKQFQFSGHVEIDLLFKEESDYIILNALDLSFSKIQIKNGTDVIDIKISDVIYDQKKQQARISLPKKFPVKATPQLSIDYTGPLADNMKGFYRSKYQRGNGEWAYCGVTQFQAMDARRALPCWDEPSIKATFTLELTVPNDLVCLSNMPETDVKVMDAMKTVLFDKSPIMSTYLLAWFVGEFEYVESKTSRDVKVRVWTAMGKKEQAIFACETACKCLDFYEKYFEIEYPLPKCDMIAVPDFALGAMENWGLVMYREIALLADKEKSSLRQLRYVAIIVCHELAHQWFGNLVTMDWWSELWLNEGFACFMEYFSADAIFPDWPMWDLFITSEYPRAFELDGMSTSHPIEVNVRNSAEAEEVFDAISYCKGACVIRMLQDYIGDEIFRKGLFKYLHHFRYANATTTDLWDYLGKEKRAPIGTIMRSWTKEQGFPLITAVRNGNKLTLTQCRYLASGTPTKEQEKVIWNVPMKLRMGNETMTVLFENKKQIIELPENTKWLHLNADSTGFYACQYDKSMMNSLIIALQKKDSNLTTLDKVSLLRDSLAVAEAGIAGATENLLNLIVSFKEEESYPVWDTILTAAQKIRHIIDDSEPTGEHFDAIMRDTLLPLYEKIGWYQTKKKDDEKDEDEDIDALLRPSILSALSKYGFKPVIDEALQRFKASMNLSSEEEKKNDGNKTNTSPSLKSVVYAIALKYGGKEEFETLKKNYLSTSDLTALRALGFTRDPESIQGLLQWLKDSDQVRTQDKIAPLRNVASGMIGREIIWTFLQKTFREWYGKFESGFLVPQLAKIPSEFVSFEKASEVEQFYSTLDYPACKRAMEQCVENIRKNAKWRQQDLSLIEKWTSTQFEKISSVKKG